MRWTDRRTGRNGATLSDSACWCMRATKMNSIFRASVKLFELGVHTPGGLFLGVWYARGIDFRRFSYATLPIFGVVFGLHEATKMYKLF